MLKDLNNSSLLGKTFSQLPGVILTPMAVRNPLIPMQSRKFKTTLYASCESRINLIKNFYKKYVILKINLLFSLR